MFSGLIFPFYHSNKPRSAICRDFLYECQRSGRCQELEITSLGSRRPGAYTRLALGHVKAQICSAPGVPSKKGSKARSRSLRLLCSRGSTGHMCGAPPPKAAFSGSQLLRRSPPPPPRRPGTRVLRPTPNPGTGRFRAASISSPPTPAAVPSPTVPRRKASAPAGDQRALTSWLRPQQRKERALSGPAPPII